MEYGTYIFGFINRNVTVVICCQHFLFHCHNKCLYEVTITRLRIAKIDSWQKLYIKIIYIFRNWDIFWHFLCYEQNYYIIKAWNMKRAPDGTPSFDIFPKEKGTNFWKKICYLSPFLTLCLKKKKKKKTCFMWTPSVQFTSHDF